MKDPRKNLEDLSRKFRYLNKILKDLGKTLKDLSRDQRDLSRKFQYLNKNLKTLGRTLRDLREPEGSSQEPGGTLFQGPATG